MDTIYVDKIYGRYKLRRMKIQKDTRVMVHLGLKRELAAKLDQLAKAENRTRLNMIIVLLQQALTPKENVTA